ncbi:flagellar export chaperone FliS [Candidatus Njordibacter sp. Uisw_058]|jgi:flagellar protein FliS|uniref:flagellar export chaperone FliS n=1 Tax=Candidatus Njordibacter sp. Uisw_058 TaxID=3230974 RepID=UPI003D3D9425
MFRRSPLQQYGNVQHDAQAEFASAHEKTLMLFDGAITFIGVALQAIARSDYELKGKMISKSIAVVNGLKDCLDMSHGELPSNLHDLYEYMVEKLFQANLTSDVEAIKEIQLLLKTVRESWAQIPSEMHQISSSKDR